MWLPSLSSNRQLAASAEPFTVPTTALPGLPASRALCSPTQLRCGSGECLPLGQRCDLQLNCQDGSDEDNCGMFWPEAQSRGACSCWSPLLSPGVLSPAVDCVLAPWSGWSDCSRSCGLGLIFQHRELLRPPLPGGSCLLDQFRSQSCFVQACPGSLALQKEIGVSPLLWDTGWFKSETCGDKCPALLCPGLWDSSTKISL